MVQNNLFKQWFMTMSLNFSHAWIANCSVITFVVTKSCQSIYPLNRFISIQRIDKWNQSKRVIFSRFFLGDWCDLQVCCDISRITICISSLSLGVFWCIVGLFRNFQYILRTLSIIHSLWKTMDLDSVKIEPVLHKRLGLKFVAELLRMLIGHLLNRLLQRNDSILYPHFLSKN